MLFASGWVGEERRYTPGGAREGVNLPIPLPFQPPTQIHRGWENRGTQVCTGLKEFTETRVPPLRYLFILCVCVPKGVNRPLLPKRYSSCESLVSSPFSRTSDILCHLRKRNAHSILSSHTVWLWLPYLEMLNIYMCVCVYVYV